MKIKNLLFGMLACTALVGCSNDDEPNVPVSGESYVAINIVSPGGSSRGTAGGYKDGSETEYIYRYVDNDVVTNVVSGPNPIYRHSISLIEITKILERVAVDNLTFTNYLDDNYGTDTPIKLLYDYNDVKNISTGSSMMLAVSVAGYYGIQIPEIKYTNDSNYFYGPYRILQKSGYKLATKKSQTLCNG